MATLMQASDQWSSRPADERFTSLIDLQAHVSRIRSSSRSTIVSTRQISAVAQDRSHLTLVGPTGAAFAPTNWAFRQLAKLAEAPASYLATLPAPIAADCINYGLKFKRDIEDVGVLSSNTHNVPTIRAVTGPRYGRVWNSDVVDALVKRFGDGISGDWRVPGIFGKKITVDQENTTLYAGDRDMWVFLADEERRIEIPNRRDGKAGSLARGFFMWNSEVGSETLGIATFLFDYVCGNRIVWGAQEFNEIRIRHTASAPDRFIEEVSPALLEFSRSSESNILNAIAAARRHRFGEGLDAFLAERFGKRMAPELKAIHMEEEGRPIETLWDVTTAITAKARSLSYQDERIELERQGGAILDLASV